MNLKYFKTLNSENELLFLLPELETSSMRLFTLTQAIFIAVILFMLGAIGGGLALLLYKLRGAV